MTGVGWICKQFDVGREKGGELKNVGREKGGEVKDVDFEVS